MHTKHIYHQLHQSWSSWSQVVANPFWFGRLHRPGQPVPFLFVEFQPQEALQPDSVGESALAPSTAPLALAPDRSANVLQDIMDIVKAMLGPMVRPNSLFILL